MLQKIKNVPRKKKALLLTLLFTTFIFTAAFFTLSDPQPVTEIISPVLQEVQKTSQLLTCVQRLVKRGDTIINALKREGIDHQTAYKFFTEVKPVYNLRKIGAGKPYALFFSPDKELLKFRYQLEANRYLEVLKNKPANCFKGKLVTVPYDIKKEVIKGEIETSLFESILDCGEKPELADLLASLYEFDIDFNRDLRKKDSFAIVVEKRYLKGRFTSYGKIQAAEFVNKGKAFRVINYTDPDGKNAYYHPDGRSVKKMFLRCPLPFMRVTSGYGNRRHPVLGFSARHNGVDFAAPSGTRVRTTASGTVIEAGYHRGRGKYIRIRHPNRYISNYYHLSRIAKSIRRGVKVEQSQLIGYVGSTGLSTGPHLHYGLRKSGRFINPLRLKSPTKNPVKKKFLSQFKQYAARHFLVISGSRLVNIPKPVQDVLLSPTPATLQPSNPVGLQ
ncbi:MAG: M23 family metallopeptidase [Chloroflexi bacterium]|nr:M23 family metallopeptidase [Chloroflexota bacterium]